MSTDLNKLAIALRNGNPDVIHTILSESLDTPSEYLVEAARRANSTSEQERRAELAQAAFLETASAAQLIFLAKSEAHTLNQRPYISQAAFDELLLAECMRLTKGDVVKAQLLASVARE